jgi:hypothetical protein
VTSHLFDRGLEVGTSIKPPLRCFGVVVKAGVVGRLPGC